MNTKPAGPRYIPRAEEGEIDEVAAIARGSNALEREVVVVRRRMAGGELRLG